MSHSESKERNIHVHDTLNKFCAKSTTKKPPHLITSILEKIVLGNKLLSEITTEKHQL